MWCGCGVGVILMCLFSVCLVVLLLEVIGCCGLKVVVNIVFGGRFLVISVCVIVSVCLVDSF